MKIRVIRDFKDIIDSSITHKVGEVLSLDDESRGQNIINMKYGELIPDKVSEIKKAVKRAKK